MSGPLFYDSVGEISGPGVGAVDVQAPVVIEGVPNGKMALAGQFDWGPAGEIVEPSDTAEAAATFWPQGSPRTSSGYRALMKRKRLALALVRVLHADAVKASSTVSCTGGAATSATVTSAAGPFDFRGRTSPHLRLAFTSGGDQDFTLAHAPATKAGASSSYPSTGTFDVTVRGWPVAQSVTITAAADAADEAAQINSQVVGLHAEVNGTQVDLVSDDEGSGAYVTVANRVNSIGNVGIANGTANGTGDCVDLGAVTAAELATKCSTLTNGTLVANGAAVVMTSTATGASATAQSKSAGTASTALGGEFASHVVKSGAAAGSSGNWIAEAKYEGAQGNSIVITQEDSSDGVSGSKKFTASMTDSVTGTFSETIVDNVAPPNGGTAISVDCSNLRLIGSFTVASNVSSFGSNGDTTLGSTVSGSNGSAVTSSDYLAALTLLNDVDNVTVMTTDDPGNSLRSTVNSSLHGFASNAAGRYLALIQGAPGNNWAAVKADKLNFTSKWALYFAAWAYVKDDGGTSRLVPTTTFAGSAIINLDPEQSHARAASFVTAYYDGIDSLYRASFNPSSSGVQADAMNLGIQIMQREPSGAFSFSHDRNCNTTVADRYAITSRLRRFFALSLTEGLREYRNAPNVSINQRDVVKAMKQFMEEQVRKGRANSYALDPKSNNTTNSLASGYFIVGDAAQTPAPMERIALLIKAAPTVTVEAPA